MNNKTLVIFSLIVSLIFGSMSLFSNNIWIDIMLIICCVKFAIISGMFIKRK